MGYVADRQKAVLDTPMWSLEEFDPEQAVNSETAGRSGTLPVGLTLIFRHTHYVIDSEMLNPPMSIAVYFTTSDAANAGGSERILARSHRQPAEERYPAPWRTLSPPNPEASVKGSACRGDCCSPSR